MDTSSPLPVRIGVSSCLLGAQVRFDGGHKKDSFLVHELGRHVEWVPVCPELEVGMGVPREAVRLVKATAGPMVDGIRMVGLRSGRDWTEAMDAYSRTRVKALERLELSGYILKSKSPSCGMERVKVYNPNGMAAKKRAAKEARGLFAAVLLEHFPLLPVEEEGRLHDALLRENFIERVFCHHRWLLFRKERFSIGRLAELHRRHKYLLLAHSGAHLRRLGRIVGSAKGRPAAEVADEYAQVFFEALEKRPSVRTHVNVLQHIHGFFKAKLEAADRKELLEAIESYRRGLVPRLVPQTLILHHLRRHGISYIQDQYYLSPHPKELVLRFHA